MKLKVHFSKWTSNWTASVLQKQQQMQQMDMPVDYYVWGTMLEFYRRHAKAEQHAKMKTVDNMKWFVTGVK